MSPRRNRRQAAPARTGRPGGTVETVESWPDGEWVVRAVPASHDDRLYRCPGCDHEIRGAVAHLVCWPVDAGADARRHWHRPCWRARIHRTPRTPRPH
ncbi:MAG: ATP/GTP-binding protein [Micromonosporaceae bacterium]